jgi:hypothetical protein
MERRRHQIVDIQMFSVLGETALVCDGKASLERQHRENLQL